VPVPEGTHVVLLVADSSAELLELSEELKRANIHHVLVREPDPPYSGAPTALGVEPMDRERVRPFMRKFGVLK
jgi:hypothetical protein